METNVGILAIGNEVVEGQIVNRNAAWLSEETSKMGASPLYHMDCRDDDQEIKNSLNFLSQHCHLILISGGLGPTRDDGTRKSLSEWLSLPLELDENQWRIIQDKLEYRDLTIREGHKTQALMPKTAVPLNNKNGVAPGFFVKGGPCFVACLPGPPSELIPMFNNELKPLIVKNLSPKSDKTLNTWICLGAPESEVAHIVESVLGNTLEIGYRLHKPYVEVKVWLPKKNDPESQKKLQTMETKLKPWLVSRSIHSIRENFHQYLEKFSHVFIIDHLTSGLFLERLKEHRWADHLRYQCFEHKSFRFFQKSEVQGILQELQSEKGVNNLFISLFPASESSAFVSFDQEIRLVETPRNIPIRSQLGQLYVVENCFLFP